MLKKKNFLKLIFVQQRFNRVTSLEECYAICFSYTMPASYPNHAAVCHKKCLIVIFLVRDQFSSWNSGGGEFSKTKNMPTQKTWPMEWKTGATSCQLYNADDLSDVKTSGPILLLH